MSMVVRTNTMSSNAFRQLSMNNSALSKSLEKLSSGYRINRAGDDASGLAISEKMKAQIQGLDQASSNSEDGISLVQTSEGALTEVHSMLNRMVELATKSANGTIQDDVDRDAIQTEVDALNTEISRIAKSTNFNGINLLDGSLGDVAAQATVAGTDAVGGAAAVYSLDFSAKTADTDYTSKNIDGIDLTWDTDAATTLSAWKDTYNADTSKSYTASVSGTTVTLTAKAIGAVATPPATTVADVTASEETAGADPTTAATAAKVTLDYTGKTGDDAIGTTVKVGDTTYEFVKTGDSVKTSGNTAVEVADTAAATDIANALSTAIGTATFDTSYTGSVVTIASKTTGASSVAPKVDQAGGGLTLQVGDTNADFNKVSVSIDDLSAEGLGTDGLDVSSQDAAGDAIQTIKDAINKVSTNRGNLGALQNRLEHAINNLDTTSENMDSANSRIRDTDMAKEMMNYTKMNILTQAAQAMLAQANQQPQSILQLLQ